jgi:hypothetical protein
LTGPGPSRHIRPVWQSHKTILSEDDQRSLYAAVTCCRMYAPVGQGARLFSPVHPGQPRSPGQSLAYQWYIYHDRFRLADIWEPLSPLWTVYVSVRSALRGCCGIRLWFRASLVPPRCRERALFVSTFDLIHLRALDRPSLVSCHHALFLSCSSSRASGSRSVASTCGFERVLGDERNVELTSLSVPFVSSAVRRGALADMDLAG